MSIVQNIDALLEEIVTLPSAPQTLARVTKMMSDPHCSLVEVGKVIGADPAIALKTLRLVNSAYYGLGQRVASVDHAVVLLGSRVVRNLVLTATVFDAFEWSAESMLRHSIACGMAMRIIVERRPRDYQLEPEDAFAYGLLHDIGKLILQQFLPDECAKALELSVERRIPFYKAEREVIGVDHGALGARLIRQWNLPEQMALAVGGHHDLAACTDAQWHSTTAALAAANFICSQSAITFQADIIPEVPTLMWAASLITGPEVPTLLDRFFASLHDVDELIKSAG